MLDKIISLFGDIAKPFVDKEGGEKLIAIQQWLNERNINNEYTPGVGLIVNKIENPRLILVSHIDLIKKFQKGFTNENKFEVLEEEGIVRGALDNTITNASALLALEELIDNGISDIELFLSEGEEVGSTGMSAYIKEYKNKSLKTFFVNLDVTNDGWGKSVSIEYDRPDFKTVKSVQKLMNVVSNYHFQGDRVGDDIDAVNSAKCHGFSFCLPTKGTIHSYKNYATLESVHLFYENLIVLLKYFEKQKKYKRFNAYNFDKALETKTYKDFKKILKKEEERYSFDNIFDTAYTGYSVNDYHNNSSNINPFGPNSVREEIDHSKKTFFTKLQDPSTMVLNKVIENYPHLHLFQANERYKMLKFIINETVEFFGSIDFIKFHWIVKEAIYKNQSITLLEVSNSLQIDTLMALEFMETFTSGHQICKLTDSGYIFIQAEIINF